MRSYKYGFVLFAAGFLFISTSAAHGAGFAATSTLGQTSLFLGGSNGAPNSTGLNYPQGIVLDTKNHRLFVADQNNNRVVVYQLTSTNAVSGHSASYVLGATDLTARSLGSSASATDMVPYALAYDPVHDFLFVSDNLGTRILVFAVAPGTIANGEAATYVLGQQNFTDSGSSGASSSTLGLASSLAYDPASSRLFAADPLYNRVLVYDLSGGITNGMPAVHVLGQANFTGSGSGTSSSTLSGPNSLAYDSAASRLFVGENGNQRVVVFNAATSTLADGASAVHVLGQANFTTNTQNGTTNPGHDKIFNPSFIDYSTSTGQLFVADVGWTRALIFNAATSTLVDNSAAANVLGQADFLANDTGTTSSSSINGEPQGIAYDPLGEQLYLVDLDANRVLVYDLSGGITNGMAANEVLGQTDEAGSADFVDAGPDNGPSAQSMSLPRDVALDTVDHRLFVAEENNARVLVYSLDSSNDPTSAVASYVLGQQAFRAVDTSTEDAGTINEADAVAYDSAHKRLFVSDGNSHNRVLVYDLSGGITNGMAASYVLGKANFTTNTAGATVLNQPGSLAYDAVNDRLFVGSSANIYVFDAANLSNGMAASATIGDGGVTASTSTFNGLHALAYDPANQRLFGADSTFNRVLVFNVGSSLAAPDGIGASYVLGHASFSDDSSASASSSTLANPGTKGSLAYDAKHKLLFVGDTGNNRVLAFNVKPSALTNGESASVVLGQSNFTDNGPGVGPTSLNSPMGIAYDQGNNRIWVADGGNNRLLRFDAIKIKTATLPAAIVNQAYSQAIDTADTQGTVTFTLSDGALPPGMVLGSVDGTPTTAGTYTFTVQANDALNGSGAFFDDQEFTLTVDPVVAQAASESGRRIVGVGSSGSGSRPSSSTSTPTSTPPAAPTPAPFRFLRDLRLGMTGDDVRALQVFLNTHGFVLAASGPGSPGHETTLFGGLTKKALIRFQEAHAAEVLTPVGLAHGTGYFGPSTRNFVNGLVK